MQSVVMVTGGASGLGRTIAETLFERQWSVLLVDRDADALSATSAELESRFGRRPTELVADLSSLEGVRAAAASEASAEVGALVNNAGGWLPGPQYPDAPPSMWTAALTLNLLAPMLLTQLLWSRLAERAGGVVNVGSSGGIGDEPYGSPEYGAAKAGLRRFTAAMGSRAGVRVMAVVPAWIGLERAHVEYAALSPQERAASGPPIPPVDVAEAGGGPLGGGGGGGGGGGVARPPEGG